MALITNVVAFAVGSVGALLSPYDVTALPSATQHNAIARPPVVIGTQPARATSPTARYAPPERIPGSVVNYAPLSASDARVGTLAEATLSTRDATQATHTARPTLVTRLQQTAYSTALPVRKADSLLFIAGTSCYLNGPTITDVITTTAWSAVIEVDVDSLPSNDETNTNPEIINAILGCSGGAFAVGVRKNVAAGNVVQVGGGIVNTSFVGPMAWATAHNDPTVTTSNGTKTWGVMSLVYDGSTLTARWNKEAPSVTTGTGTQFNGGGRLLIGQNLPSSGAFFNGYVGEILIYNRALTEQEVLDTVDALNGVTYGYGPNDVFALPDAAEWGLPFQAPAPTFGGDDEGGMVFARTWAPQWSPLLMANDDDAALSAAAPQIADDEQAPSAPPWVTSPWSVRFASGDDEFTPIIASTLADDEAAASLLALVPPWRATLFATDEDQPPSATTFTDDENTGTPRGRWPLVWTPFSVDGTEFPPSTTPVNEDEQPPRLGAWPERWRPLVPDGDEQPPSTTTINDDEAAPRLAAQPLLWRASLSNTDDEPAFTVVATIADDEAGPTLRAWSDAWTRTPVDGDEQPPSTTTIDTDDARAPARAWVQPWTPFTAGDEDAFAVLVVSTMVDEEAGPPPIVWAPAWRARLALDTEEVEVLTASDDDAWTARAWALAWTPRPFGETEEVQTLTATEDDTAPAFAQQAAARGGTLFTADDDLPVAVVPAFEDDPQPVRVLQPLPWTPRSFGDEDAIGVNVPPAVVDDEPGARLARWPEAWCARLVLDDEQDRSTAGSPPFLLDVEEARSFTDTEEARALIDVEEATSETTATEIRTIIAVLRARDFTAGS